MRSVAVCLAGLLKSLPDAAPSIQEFLVEPLDADVFIAGPLLGAETWLPSLALFPSLAEARLVRENVTQALHAEGGGRWQAAARVKGNWLGCLEWEPQDMRRSSSGLCQMFSHRQCLEMLSTHEHRRGRQYDRVVYSRADMRWEGPHLPLSLLPARHGEVYVMEGEDYGGMNDRHWVIPRPLAEELLGSWTKLVDGTITQLFQNGVPPLLNSEAFFQYLWWRAGLTRSVRRMPPTSAVLCSNHHSRRKTDMSASGLNDTDFYTDFDVRCRAGGPKYRKEYRKTHSVATCLGARAWSWSMLYHCWCEQFGQAAYLDLEYALCIHAQQTVLGLAGSPSGAVR